MVARGLGVGQEFAPPLVAATVAGAMLVTRTLAVPVRAWSWAVVLAGTGAQVVTAGLVPAGALAAAGLGTLTGACLQLAFGTSYGSVAPVNVADLVSQLGVTAGDICPAPYAPTWGVARGERAGEPDGQSVGVRGHDAAQEAGEGLPGLLARGQRGARAPRARPGPPPAATSVNGQ